MDATQSAVRAVRSVGPATVAIDIETPPEFDAQPGQFVKLTFYLVDTFDLDAIERLASAGKLDVDDVDHLGPDEDVTVSRFYTISSPDVDDTFEITVDVDPDGTVGPLLDDLAPGDVITFSGPFGTDYYEGEDPVVILAGGPGVGPAIGVAERAIADDHGVSVLYQASEPIHEERIDALEENGATVALIDTNDELDAAVADVLDEYGGESHLFVYGFAGFINAATTAIEASGGNAGGAKIENFG